VLYPDNDEWRNYEWEGGCEDLHIVEGEDGVYYMNYTTWSGSADTVSMASSRDLVHWTKHGPAFRKAGKIGGRSGVVISKLAGDRLIAAKVNGKYWMYYTHPCALAASENLMDWTPTWLPALNRFIRRHRFPDVRHGPPLRRLSLGRAKPHPSGRRKAPSQAPANWSA
jgi:hypothetical protein